MPQQLQYVAQLAMDNFYQSYKGEDDFFDLEDFISMCGNTVAAIYLSFYQQEYNMLRQESKDEVVSFDSGWLLEKDLKVEKESIDSLYAILDEGVMTFPYDRSSIGIQNIFITDPSSTDEVERTNISSVWRLKYIPKTNKIWFYTTVSNEGTKIQFINKGDCNIKKVKVLYVPTMTNPDSPVADGVISDAVIKTVVAMKQIASGNVVDQTANMNGNKIMQTEIDKNTLGNGI